MRLALKLSIDSTLTDLDLDAPEGSLKVLQDAVGGYIEPVDLDDDNTMYVNETGKLDGLKPNILATLIYCASFPVQDVVMGDVVFTGGVDDDGNTMGLSDDTASGLRSVVASYVAASHMDE